MSPEAGLFDVVLIKSYIVLQLFDKLN